MRPTSGMRCCGCGRGAAGLEGPETRVASTNSAVKVWLSSEALNVTGLQREGGAGDERFGCYGRLAVAHIT